VEQAARRSAEQADALSWIGPSSDRSMTLSISQIALMSRLLDEALPLDAAGRRAWLDALPSEYRDIAPALREALLFAARHAPGSV
jgi:hypothetical protein